jgi:hypothetical protein
MRLSDEIRKILDQEILSASLWDTNFHLCLPCKTKEEMKLQMRRFSVIDRYFAKYVLRFHKRPSGEDLKSWLDDKGITVSGFSTIWDFEQYVSGLPTSLLTELSIRYIEGPPCKEYYATDYGIDTSRGFL